MENPVDIADDKVKNIIIKILSKEWPLTAKKIYYRVKKQGRGVTYQAVFKSLQELIKKSIISKEKYNYLLNKQWLENTSDFYEDLRENYLGEQKDFSRSVLKNPALTLKFDRFYRFLVALVSTLIGLRFMAKKDNYTGFAEMRNFYWPFTKGEKEERLIKKVFTEYKKIYLICKNKNAMNELISKQYKALNKNVYVKFDKNCAEECDSFATGNIIAQIFFPDRVKQEVDKLFSKKYTKEEFLVKFDKFLFLKKTKITVAITRNPGLAKIKKQKILKAFGRSKP